MKECAMKRFRLVSFVVVMACATLFAPSVFAQAVPGPTGWYIWDMHAHRSYGGSPESVLGTYGKMTLHKLSCLHSLADMGKDEVQNLATDLPLVGTRTDALADVVRKIPEPFILVGLGSLLLVLGTVLRRNLPPPDETTSSHLSELWAEPMPQNRYIGAVDGVANRAAPKRDASAA